MLIERINQILQIKSIQNEYRDTYGVEPYNVSSWLTSESFSQSMLAELKLPEIESPIEYVYTYSLDKQILSRVKTKLASNTCDESAITFTVNTTQAIVSLVNLIKRYGYKKICILNPAYFSIAQALKAFDIEYDILSVQRIDDQYVLPYEKLIAGQYDVIWTTSPIFSTGVYYNQADVDMIQQIMDSGTLVISDESFCTTGNELIRRLTNHNNFIAMYSPHKSLCINSVKFSAIIYPVRFDNFIEHWVDVLSGNLPASACTAINHFLGPNYECCLHAYREFIAAAYNEIRAIISLKNNIMFDEINDGSLFTLYFKNLSFEQIKSLAFMKNVIFSTGTSFYPSYLSGFDESFGFAFRINLALYDKNLLVALNYLINHLSEFNCKKKSWRTSASGSK